MKCNGTIFLCLVVFGLTFFSCGGNDDRPPVDLPEKAIGTLPANNEPCSEYEEVVGDDAKVLVLFEWNTAQFADSYVLTVLEGSVQVFKNSFSAPSTKKKLDRGKTYTWFLASVNEDGRTIGDSYSFSTPGVPIGNFAPYTAVITITFDEVTSEMEVSWTGSDEDGDPLTYDVKVFEEGRSIFETVDLASTAIAPIVFRIGTEYSVEVISKDGSGNFSISKRTVPSPD